MKKTIATLILGGLFAASLQADVNIHITGSTAFRANAYRAIRALYGAGLVSQNPADPASGKNQVTWTGTITNLFGSQTVNIYASYSGSVGGIQALTENISQTFLSSATNGSTNTFTAPAELAFSDCFQASTAYTSPTLVDAQVAVLPFAYVKSTITSSSFTNITFQQLQVIFANGFMPLSYFTGKTNDDATTLYYVGRNFDSGTRVAAFTDDFFTGSPQTYAPDTNCNWNITAGFSSGSGIDTVLQGTCGQAIGTLGISDATACCANGCSIVAYNGFFPFVGYTPGSAVPVTPDYTPIIKGQYSYWSYEHLFELSSSVGTTADTLRTALISGIDTDIATLTPVQAIRLNQMKVSRPSDGGPIAP